MVDWETFPAFERLNVRHAFSRRADVELAQLDQELARSCEEQGFPMSNAYSGEQTHGNEVGLVTEKSPKKLPVVDALITQLKNAPLIIRVADCGPVYIYDPIHEAIGLTHSGKKGTALNITAKTISAMRQHFGSEPKDLIVVLGPCIRPPYYEIDFAAEIGRQAKAEGVIHFHDCGVCTAADLKSYYSYRAEKGKTGRMWAVIELI